VGLAPLLHKAIPRPGRHPSRLVGLRPDLAEQRRCVVERPIALRCPQDVGGQAACDDSFVHQPPVGEQPLLVACLVAEDEQEQVLAAASTGVDRRRDALRRAERQLEGLFKAAFLGEDLIEVAQGLRVGAGQSPGASSLSSELCTVDDSKGLAC